MELRELKEGSMKVEDGDWEGTIVGGCVGLFPLPLGEAASVLSEPLPDACAAAAAAAAS